MFDNAYFLGHLKLELFFTVVQIVKACSKINKTDSNTISEDNNNGSKQQQQT